MLKWHLDVKVDRKPGFRPLEHADRLVSVGSCFSSHMSERLAYSGMRVAANPTGTLYNPNSIRQALEDLLNGREYHEEDLREHGGLWFSPDHDTSFSSAIPADVVRKTNELAAKGRAFLPVASTVLITFGTAWYYIWKDTGRLVANCHKLPQAEFDRQRMSPSDITTQYTDLIGRAAQDNPGLQWIFSVSPVRHWKDGAAGNGRSKAILLSAVHDIVDHCPQAHYFPAYEIMMDELRDYRFYAEDLVHPTDQAVSHIWDKFSAACLSDSAREIAGEVAALRRRLEHRPLIAGHPDTEAFRSETQRIAGELCGRLPYLDLGDSGPD